MTLPEMHTQVRVQFEALAAQTLDNFLPQEIDLYINRAIRSFIAKQRPPLLQERENVQSREALENLRSILESYTYSSSDFTNVSNMDGGHSVPIGDLDPIYEYFISGRLTTDQNVYSVETTTVPDFYEHLETRHNIPHFRRAKIIERGDKFLLALPDPDETPDSLEMTYLGEFSQVDIELVVEYTVSQGGGNETATIDIEGVSYNIPWNTDASTTVDDFISNHKSDVRSNHDVFAEDLGDKIRFTTFNPEVLESEFGKADSSADVSLSKSTETSRNGIPLPSTTHQQLIQITVNLMRNDLPQAQPQSQSQEEQ